LELSPPKHHLKGTNADLHFGLGLENGIHYIDVLVGEYIYWYLPDIWEKMNVGRKPLLKNGKKQEEREDDHQKEKRISQMCASV
jgi:hypothetical protein